MLDANLTGNSGFGGGRGWNFGEPSRGYFYYTPVAAGDLNQWVHLALVFQHDANINQKLEQVYINGSLVDSRLVPTPTPTATIPTFGIGGYVGDGFGQVDLNGLIDNFRVFTFATGQFDSTHDLLIPEPSVVGLAVMGGALAFGRRRRR